MHKFKTSVLGREKFLETTNKTYWGQWFDLSLLHFALYYLFYAHTWGILVNMDFLKVFDVSPSQKVV